jgi:hypothetical protein
MKSAVESFASRNTRSAGLSFCLPERMDFAELTSREQHAPYATCLLVSEERHWDNEA